MRPIQLAGPAVAVAGIIALAYGMIEGEATLSLFVIFPVVTATGPWAIVGIVLLIAGVFVFFLTGFQPTEMGTAPRSPNPPAATPGPTSAPVRRWGGIVFLGPFPVVFGSDQKVTQWMLVVGIVLFVALVVLTIISLRGI